MKGTLYLVPTSLNPESNGVLLQEDLKKIAHIKDFIAEDPKVARRNIKNMEMDTIIQEIEIEVLDEHTKPKEYNRLLMPINEGRDVALMSDAGCPGVADPGGLFIMLCHQKNINVVPLVGPSSILLSLMGSGLNGQRFSFVGYLPVDQAKREDLLRKLENESMASKSTQIFMDTPYRNKHLWRSILEVCKDTTEISISIDLTGPNQYIKTATVKQWKQMKWPEMDKVPAIFLMLGHRA
jgi:16S rRNA (cytidine1402-2'-O)-methyltransferase